MSVLRTVELGSFQFANSASPNASETPMVPQSRISIKLKRRARRDAEDSRKRRRYTGPRASPNQAVLTRLSAPQRSLRFKIFSLPAYFNAEAQSRERQSVVNNGPSAKVDSALIFDYCGVPHAHGGVAKWEGRGLQNLYERVRLPPPPLPTVRIDRIKPTPLL